MKWLSMVGAAGSSYIFYWVAAVITAVAFYVGVINIDNVRLENIVSNYVQESELYDRELVDSANAEEVRHRFVESVTDAMGANHAKAELSHDARRILAHFKKTNLKFNMVLVDIAEGSKR